MLSESVQKELTNLKKEPDALDLDGAVPDFTCNGNYTTFRVEHALIEGNIVLHFFPPEEMEDGPQLLNYWKTIFPTTLDVVARKYFDAESPRLYAEYVPELYSWYFRANGYSHIVDLLSFLEGFFDKLDEALEA